MKSRREFFVQSTAALAAAIPAFAAPSAKLGVPGPFRGRVVEVTHPGSIASGAYQPAAIEQMVERGMTTLTGAPSWQDAWRVFFEKGDVVGIKVSPVGGPKLCSDPSVLRRIVAGLNAAGVPNRDIVVFSRYRKEIQDCSIDKWLPEGARWTAPAWDYENIQLGMEGYDPDVFMEMAVVQPGQNPSDAHNRRSYVSQVVTRQINKFVNLPVLKHHQSAGVTIALKNMSHGMSNNVARSHTSPTLNVCGAFIPAVVNLPVLRQKAVLHIVDAVKAQYHGGPGGRPQFVWEHKTMYFGTDPVAVDKTGWKALDAQRVAVGMAKIADSKPDAVSTFLNCQVEHIEIAGALGLGEFDDKKIDVRKVALS
ncbi:MAG: DUF362 domain-containing protein [Acidobacteria bacterium]|nr:DUF362 domain-containing protein [Acidobacteriota bacterium]